MNPSVEKRPLVSGALTRRLRDQILAAPEGERLGSEPEIMKRLNVSRSTLRQVARMLEQEQLLEVKRGMNGGYFTRRPDASAVARSAALYLRLRNATVQHLSNVSRVLNVELHRLAALSKDEPSRQNLQDTLEGLKATGRPDLSVREFLHRREKVRRCVYALAGDPFLELFLGITNLFGGQMDGAPIFADHPERIPLWEARTWRLVEAVLHGEAEVAQALVNQDWRILEDWLAPYGAAPVLVADQPAERTGQASESGPRDHHTVDQEDPVSSS